MFDVQAANARERRRMDRMNAAYVKLRAALPGHREHLLLSKRQTVQQVAVLPGNMGLILDRDHVSGAAVYK